MKKFQYLVVKMRDVESEKGEDFKKLSFYEQQQIVLNELGENGWELVHVYDGNGIFHMKREIT